MLKNDKYIIKKLDWDTEQFNVSSARVILKKEILNSDLEDIKKHIEDQRFRFITIENKNNNENNNLILNKLNNIFLADINVQFQYSINNEDKFNTNEHIKIENNLNKNEEILKIAEQSFNYSRFINDNNLNNNRFNVYEEWANNSFQKENKYFCYCMEKDKIIGYILFSIEQDNNSVFLELICIDKQNRGKGIGSKLLRELKTFALKKGISYIKVGTQINNIQAQNFYIKNGFKHIENHSIYHWWIGENNRKKCLIVSTVSRQFTLFERGNIKVLKELGYEIHCAANFSDSIQELDELPIIKHEFDIQRSPFSLKNIKAYKQLKKIINSENYTIIHCHSPMGGVLARLAARETRKVNLTKVLYTAHGFHFYKGAPLLNWLIYYPIEKWLSKYTDCIITINKEDYNIAKRKFKKCKQIELVNGVGLNTEKFDKIITEDEKKILKNELSIKENDLVLSYTAELNKNKNQILLINTVEMIKRDFPNIKLLLIGKGELKEYYTKIVKEKKLEDNIKILGERKDIAQLLSITNIYVASSLREGLPVNIMEAMYMGLPIVASDNRGHRELVKEGKNGYIIEVNKTEDMMRKIKTIKENKKIRDIMKKYSQEIIEPYKLENIMKKMEKVYKTKILS